MDINELYLHQFKSFLLKAKLHGYAGGDRLKIRSRRPTSLLGWLCLICNYFNACQSST